MALIVCEDCGREVSTEAAACPSCGRQFSRNSDEALSAIAIILICVAGLVVFVGVLALLNGAV